MNYLRNHSSVIKAKLEAQTALAKERASHVEIKLQMKQQKTLTDNLQSQLETLHTEKTNLQSNKTTFGEADFQPVFGVLDYFMVKMVKNLPSARHDK